MMEEEEEQWFMRRARSALACVKRLMARACRIACPGFSRLLRSIPRLQAKIAIWFGALDAFSCVYLVWSISVCAHGIFLSIVPLKELSPSFNGRRVCRNVIVKLLKWSHNWESLDLLSAEVVSLIMPSYRGHLKLRTGNVCNDRALVFQFVPIYLFSPSLL